MLAQIIYIRIQRHHTGFGQKPSEQSEPTSQSIGHLMCERVLIAVQIIAKKAIVINILIEFGSVILPICDVRKENQIETPIRWPL